MRSQGPLARRQLVLAAGLVLAACSAPASPAAPAPAATPTTAPSGASPTTAAVAASVTPAPSATPTTEPSATPTPSPSATPSRFGPDSYPPGINPLTGRPVSDPAALERRPIAIKVSEFPRRVRPQAGLSLADLVFEHYAEAGITRMTALFLGNDSPQVGSIRSARLIDLVLAESYDAMLVTSGSSQGVLKALSRTSFYERVIAEATGYDECPPLCRLGNEPSTNNLFAATADLWQTTTDLGLNGPQDLHGMAFEAEAPPGGAPAATVHIDFKRDYNVAEWRYDPALGRYARWVDTATAGELAPHTDLVNGEQLTADNVVVLYANHVTTDMPEDFGNGGHCGYEIQIWATGPAWLFRDGQAYELTWVRFKTDDVIGLVGPDNAMFPFKPGNTWFEVLNLNSPTTFEDGVFNARFRGPSQSVGCPIVFAAP